MRASYEARASEIGVHGRIPEGGTNFGFKRSMACRCHGTDQAAWQICTLFSSVLMSISQIGLKSQIWSTPAQDHWMGTVREEWGRNVFQDWFNLSKVSIIKNSQKMLPWEVSTLALSGECSVGERVESVLLEGSFLPSALAFSIRRVTSSGASEEVWLILEVWIEVPSFEPTVWKSSGFWSKAMLSVWGSVLFSGQWFLTAAETRKHTSEN